MGDVDCSLHLCHQKPEIARGIQGIQMYLFRIIFLCIHMPRGLFVQYVVGWKQDTMDNNDSVIVFGHLSRRNLVSSIWISNVYFFQTSQITKRDHIGEESTNITQKSALNS